MKLNKSMIGKTVIVTANGKTGYKKIVGILVDYRKNEFDVLSNSVVGTYERSEGWKITIK